MADKIHSLLERKLVVPTYFTRTEPNNEMTNAEVAYLIYCSFPPVFPARLEFEITATHTNKIPSYKKYVATLLGSSPLLGVEIIESMWTKSRRYTGQATEAMYGELTAYSVLKVFAYMRDNCNFNSDSVFLDLGSGRGLPVLAATVVPGVTRSIGIELDSNSHSTSEALLKEFRKLKLVGDEKEIFFYNEDFTDSASTFRGATHVYSFNKGMPGWAGNAPARNNVVLKLVEKFNETESAQYLACSSKPRTLFEYGLNADFMDQIENLSLGKEHTTFYVYRKRAEEQ